MTVEIYIFSILILIIVVFLILTFIPTSFTAVNVQDKKNYDLNTYTQLFNSQYNYSDEASCTFQGFLYLETLQKTGTAISCSTTDASLPNCSSGRYPICKCGGIAGNECTNCYHKGYIPLINLNDIVVLEALAAPDASRQGRASVQLTIKTQSSGHVIDTDGNSTNPVSNRTTVSDIYLETFVLPPLPFQQWIMISISREGRRFDIYYNDALVLSKMTTSVLDNGITTHMAVGNPMINGSAGFFSYYPTIQSSSQISKQYSSFVSMRGSPLFDQPPPTIGLTEVSLDRLGGVSLNVPSLCDSDKLSPSANPNLQWTSSYA